MPYLVEVEMEILRETAKAVLSTLDDEDDAVWLPKSQIIINESNDRRHERCIIAMPEWLAIDKRLI